MPLYTHFWRVTVDDLRRRMWEEFPDGEPGDGESPRHRLWWNLDAAIRVASHHKGENSIDLDSQGARDPGSMPGSSTEGEV